MAHEKKRGRGKWRARDTCVAHSVGEGNIVRCVLKSTHLIQSGSAAGRSVASTLSIALLDALGSSSRALRSSTIGARSNRRSKGRLKSAKSIVSMSVLCSASRTAAPSSPSS